MKTKKLNYLLSTIILFFPIQPKPYTTEDTSNLPFLTSGNLILYQHPWRQYIKLNLWSGHLMRFPLNTRMNYINKYIFNATEDKFRFYSPYNFSENFTLKVKSIMYKNEGYAKSSGKIFVDFEPLHNIDKTNLCATVRVTPFEYTDFYSKEHPPPPKKIINLDSSNCFLTKFKSTHYLSEGNEKIVEFFFKLVKLYFDLGQIVIIYLYLKRPEWASLRLIWTTETYFHLNLLFYIGFSPGYYGGFVNKINYGMIKASKTVLFFFSDNYRYSKSFTDYMDRAGFYKKIMLKISPSVPEELFIESIVFIILLLIFTFFKLKKEKNKAKKAYDTMFIFFSFNILKGTTIGFCYMHAFNYIPRNKYYIFFYFCFLTLLFFFSMRIFLIAKKINSVKYLRKKKIYTRTYLKIEPGDAWAFNTYINSETNSYLRSIKIFFLLSICVNLAYGEAKINLVLNIVNWFLYSCCILFEIFYFRLGNKEREDTLKILKMSLIHSVFMMIFNIFFLRIVIEDITLKWTIIFSYAFSSLLLIDIYLLCFQLFLRVKFALIKPDYLDSFYTPVEAETDEDEKDNEGAVEDEGKKKFKYENFFVRTNFKKIINSVKHASKALSVIQEESDEGDFYACIDEEEMDK